MRIRLASAGDSAAIASLYAPYVTQSAVSFETEPPDPAEMAVRIASGGSLYPWLVAEDEEGALLGYASAAAFRARAAYRFTVETSVYLAAGAQGRGVASALYAALLAVLERQGFTQAIAAIVVPNEASERLHRRFGFVRAGTYERVGYKLGRWWSVALWQLALAPASDEPEEPRPFSGLLPG